MSRIALRLAYDGRSGAGWQTQPGGIALQDQLEAALSAVAGHAVHTICAGRTDAGVHAITQVVHFDTEAQRPLNAWVRGVNAHLGARLAVQEAVSVDADFHARFDATRRRYHFLIHQAPVHNPLLDGRVAWVHQTLDLEAMRAAASQLIGTHDFAAFRSSQCQANTSVRDMSVIAFETYRELISIEFVANAFLHHMIRNLVGSLFQIGIGKQSPAWLADVLASRDRTQAASTFSAHGLYLTGVAYRRTIAMKLWPEAPAGLLWC